MGICCEKGITKNTFYDWRSLLGSMDSIAPRRLRELEREIREYARDGPVARH